MSGEGSQLLRSLCDARWTTITRTFGNAHSTMIGILVDWWTSGAPGSRWALDGGPSLGYRARSVGGGGQCDALLCEHGDAVGVVEVEGTRILSTIDKIGRFFASDDPDFQSLRFAVCLLYAYTPQGRGPKRRFLPVMSGEAQQRLLTLSATCADKSVILVAIEKDYDRHQKGIRCRSEYYYGTSCRITGTLFMNGEKGEPFTYCEAS
jgi:hypothetical protein